MPSSFRLPVVLAVLAIAGFLWLAFVGPYRSTARSRPPETPGPEAAAPGPVDPAGDPPAAPGVLDSTNTDERFLRFTDGTVHWLPALEASRELHRGEPPRGDLEVLDRILADYRLVYRENPVGTENAEIVAQLLGDNPKQVVFLDPELPALNDRGELLDRWGTPFRFHPLRADLMDVISLGPDRTPWTGDDLSLGLEAEEEELQLNPAPDR